MIKSKWYGKERLRELDLVLVNRVKLATEFVSGEAKRRCPVDTGNLRSSLETETITENGEIVGRVGTNVEYALHVEYGTKSQSAQPFLRPSLIENKDQITNFLNGN